MLFGEIVRAHRHQENLSLNELAEQSGVSRSILARIESGETRQPRFSTARTIASALKIPYEQVILFYLAFTHQTETFKALLAESISHENKNLVRLTATKFLESAKSNNVIVLDYLLQIAKATEQQEIRLTLYNVMIDYTRRSGIPFYYVKSLFERYLIERYDFSRLEETYQKGKELLFFLEYLQPEERVLTYYRLGLHAYALKFFDEAIEHCRKGIKEDTTESELKASVLLAITNAYLNLGECIISELFLKEYENNPFKEENHARYLRAQLYAKKQHYAKAVEEFKVCLAEAAHEDRIAIATDLMEVLLLNGESDLVRELILAEQTFLPQLLNTPKKIEHTALYYKQKGKFELENNSMQTGLDSMLESASYYQQLGDYKEMNSCIGLMLAAFRLSKENISVDYLEKIEKLCNN